MRTAIAMMICASFCCSCSSPVLDKRPYQVPTVCLSRLEETVVECDSFRYVGINVIIVTNDLGSDIFLRSPPIENFVATPVNSSTAFRLPDTDGLHHQLQNEHMGRATIIRSVEYEDTFTFVWAGNTAQIPVYSPFLSPDKSYFPITYYHCNDKGFYTRSIRIVEADTASHGTAPPRRP